LNFILQRLIIAQQGANSKLKAAVGKDIKGKLSPLFYTAAIACLLSINGFHRALRCGCADVADSRPAN
jgi:hypothetical protein